jgi:hypothetical protein
MDKNGELIPQLPVSCLAEYVTRGGRSPESILRPYKFRERGEGHVRIVFHPPVVAVIRKYYSQGRDPNILEAAIADWQKRSCTTDKKSLRGKLHSNIIALNSFRQHYEHKNFKVLPIRRISCPIGPLTFTASPDLWVEVEGKQFLIKIGFGRKKRSYADVILAVMRRAALIHGHRIRQHNAVYLNVMTGEEFVGRFGYKRIALTLERAASEIAQAWPRVSQVDVPTALVREGPGFTAHRSGPTRG